ERSCLAAVRVRWRIIGRATWCRIATRFPASPTTRRRTSPASKGKCVSSGSWQGNPPASSTIQRNQPTPFSFQTTGPACASSTATHGRLLHSDFAGACAILAVRQGCRAFADENVYRIHRDDGVDPGDDAGSHVYVG